MAKLVIGGAHKALGLFDTCDLARAAHAAASQKYFGPFARVDVDLATREQSEYIAGKEQ
jgi:hypothetical protein